MKKASLNTTALGVVLAALLLLTGCDAINSRLNLGLVFTSVEDARAQARAAATPKITSGLKREGTLIVGIPASTVAPFVIEASDGTASGVDIELGCALADELGLEVAFVSVPGPAQGLAQSCDVVTNVTPLESESAELLGVYGYTAVAFFGKNVSGIAASADLAGKTVGLQEGSVSQQRLRRTTLGMNEVAFDTLNKAFDALDKGEVDYVLCPVASGAYLTNQHPGVAFCGTLDAPDAEGVAIAAGDGELQAALRTAWARIQENGVLSEILRRSFGSLPELTADSQVK